MSDAANDSLHKAHGLVGEASAHATKATQCEVESAEASSVAKVAAQKSMCEGAATALTASANTGKVCKSDRLRRAFQKLWVGGVMGTFFMAVISTIPAAYRALESPTCPAARLNITLRYGYMIWLVAYFFFSNLINDCSECIRVRDLVFDVLQSAGALVVAWSLGFLSPSDGFCSRPLIRGLIYANLDIAFICALSLLLFSDDKPNVNRYRGLGYAISTLTLGLWWPLKFECREILNAACISLAGLFVLLVAYIAKRRESLKR